MKIAIVNQYASDPETGPGGRSYYLSRALAGQGHDVAVIRADYSHLLHDPRPNTKRYETYKDAKVTQIKIRVPIYIGSRALARVRNWLLFAAKVPGARKHLPFCPDIIICSSPSVLSVWGAWLLAKITGARFVFEFRDIWPLTLIKVGSISRWHPLIVLLRVTELFALRSAELVVGFSPSCRVYLRENAPKQQAFMSLSNGIDCAAFDMTHEGSQPPLPRDLLLHLNGKFVVGYVGSLGEVNAIDTLLEAARQLYHRSDIAFVIVGKGTEKSALMQQAKDLAQVYFNDPLPKADVPACLAYFDVGFVGWRDSPLYAFGMSPQKLPEYLISGLPVLHCYSGADDPIGVNGLGVRIPAGDAPGLAKAIECLADQTPETRAKLAQKCRNYARVNYDYDALATRLATKLEAVFFR